MFNANKNGRSDRSDHKSAKTLMNLGLGNGLLVTAIAAILALAALSGTETRSLSAPNYDLERAGSSARTVPNAQILRNDSPSASSSSTFDAAATSSSRSEIMDSYESVPSLAALAKQGKAGTQSALEAARSKIGVTSGISR